MLQEFCFQNPKSLHDQTGAFNKFFWEIVIIIIINIIFVFFPVYLICEKKL